MIDCGVLQSLLAYVHQDIPTEMLNAIFSTLAYLGFYLNVSKSTKVFHEIIPTMVALLKYDKKFFQTQISFVVLAYLRRFDEEHSAIYFGIFCCWIFVREKKKNLFVAFS